VLQQPLFIERILAVYTQIILGPLKRLNARQLYWETDPLKIKFFAINQKALAFRTHPPQSVRPEDVCA
jgi:hypothetical protein